MTQGVAADPVTTDPSGRAQTVWVCAYLLVPLTAVAVGLVAGIWVGVATYIVLGVALTASLRRLTRGGQS